MERTVTRLTRRRAVRTAVAHRPPLYALPTSTGPVVVTSQGLREDAEVDRQWAAYYRRLAEMHDTAARGALLRAAMMEEQR